MMKSAFVQLEKELMELSSPGIVPGLDRLLFLMPLIGSPQNSFTAVHVVGTNGKGSTCAALTAILSEAGCRVAQYSSPHLVSFAERLQICGQPVTIEKWNETVGKIKTALKIYDAGAAARPTYFELITAAAFMIIAEENVDIAVVEAGLGGRLDATNTLGNVALTLVTPIAMDHMDYLGNDLISIAREKFAVLRTGTVAIFAGGEPEVESEFRETAARRGADAFLLRDVCVMGSVATSLAGTDFTLKSADEELQLHTPLPGYFQADNAALAICGAYMLRRRPLSSEGDACFSEITDAAVTGGISKTTWPGRLETIAENPLTILDGAHNPHAAARLSEALLTLAGCGSLNIVLALMKDKDAGKVLRLLKDLDPVVYCTQVPELERSMTAAELGVLARREGIVPAGEYSLPAAAVKASRATGRTTICCGSLYLVGYLKGLAKEHGGI